MWAARVEPDWVFQATFTLNQSRASVKSGFFTTGRCQKIIEESSFFQKNSDNYSNIYSKVKWFFILSKNRAEDWRLQKQEIGSRVRGQEIQSTRNQEIQLTCSAREEPGARASELQPEPEKYFTESERNFEYRRYVYEISVKISYEIFRNFVCKISELLFMKLQSLGS